ncbi:hypothetical protein [Burkholderia ubonensis]|uniref:hypothetical protein n=1 Tax=Burkholderia ubonensis TaxID=101571 RepID=UPI0007562959|nr:hypothetical protein [Burkholderia ubonensis]KVC58218.1 hypothetical protein WI72_14320 [Burkholderia ubonensis]KVD92915.1 hypothetical protein WI90_10670 [Burkholderia ubonensis]
MVFRWNQVIPDEEDAGEPPPIWIYLVLFIVVECFALAITVVTWPKGKSVASFDFLQGILLNGPLFWGALSALLYHTCHGAYAFDTAVTNREGWQLRSSWQRDGRSGVAVLDSVVLAPEPELGERLLGLDGTPPQNPGKVMAIDVDETGAESRLHAVLEKLLVPLTSKLARAMKSNSFQLMMQGDRDESSDAVHAVWKKLALPGAPQIIRMQAGTEPKFAEQWFAADRDPSYRLVLAWHLNDNPDAPKECSEFAVALLLASHQHWWNLRDKLKPQAWLLRGIETEADQAEEALTLLLKAEQVEPKRIRNFWHSRLKGIAQHATLGAVKESGLEVSTHALDPAIGPQAPASRWLVYALAAKMAHFGQGAQLVALPGEKGVTLNLAARELRGVNAPWKDSYAYSLIPVAEIALVTLGITGVLLLDVHDGWKDFDTAAVVMAVVLGAAFAGAKYLRYRGLVDDFRRTYRR